MKKPLSILQLTSIINHIEQMFDPDGFYPLEPAIDNLRQYAARFDASESPTEGFHRDLWLAVRAEVNRLMSIHAN